MWIIIGANLLNVFGNWVLIFGELGAPELGLFGAGLSTALARVLSLVAIIWAMLAMKRYRPYREGLFRAKPLTELRRKLLATSWPIMVQCGIECALWAIGAVVCGTFHKNQLAGYQIINTISNMGFLAYSSFANAVAIKVANYSGTHDYSEVRATARRGFRLVVVLATFISVIFLILGKPLVHMFTSDPAVMVCALALLLPMILYQYGDAIQVNYVNALRGTGQVMPLVWISLGCYGGIGVAAIFLLAVVAGLESIGVYISFSVALFSAAFFLNRAFNRAVRTQESKGR